MYPVQWGALGTTPGGAIRGSVRCSRSLQQRSNHNFWTNVTTTALNNSHHISVSNLLSELKWFYFCETGHVKQAGDLLRKKKQLLSQTHSRMKNFSSWYSIWPSSGTGWVRRIFSASRTLSTQTQNAAGLSHKQALKSHEVDYPDM